MDAPTIIRDLGTLGFRVRVEGDDLVIEPGSRLSGELFDEIRAHKPAIIALLRPSRGASYVEYQRAFPREHDAFVCPGCFEPVLLEDVSDGRTRYTNWFDGRPHPPSCRKGA